MKKTLPLIIGIVMTMIPLFMSSCVHEWPVPPATRSITLHIRHELPWDLFEWAGPQKTKASAYGPASLSARYIICVYPEGISTDAPYSKKIIYRTDLERGDFDTQVDVPSGKWDIRIWSDNVDSRQLISPYYNADNLGAVTYADPLVGGDKYKDAFAGVVTADIPQSNTAQLETGSYVVTMKRPLTAFAFIATDLPEFIDQETRRSRNEETIQGKEAAFAPAFSLDNYKVRISYTGFLPSTYHIFSDKPIDSLTGVGFFTDSRRLSDKEALLGHDFVFINGKESTMRVQLDLFHKDGSHISRVSSFDIPVKRNRCTIVRGEFLTSKATGSTGIDPGFDGEFNIEFK